MASTALSKLEHDWPAWAERAQRLISGGLNACPPDLFVGVVDRSLDLVEQLELQLWLTRLDEAPHISFAGGICRL
jgi:hypothetical protein